MRSPWSRRHKPPIGTPLDRGVGLTKGLVWFAPLAEGGGTISGEAVGSVGLNVFGGAAWTSGGSAAMGVGLTCAASGAGASATPIPPPLRLIAPLTLAVGLRWNGTTPTANAGVFGTSYSTAGGGNAGVRMVMSGTGGGVSVQYNGGNGASTTAILASGVDSVLVLSLSVLSAIGTASYYLNGVAAGTSSPLNTVSTSYTATSQISFGQQTGSTAHTTNCQFYFGAIWNRALNVTEVAAFSASPWSVFQGSLPAAAVGQPLPAALMINSPPVRDRSNSRMRLWAE